MSEPFVGEIRLLSFGWPPAGWAVCDGQLFSIAQNPTLYALIGTQFGGDGKQTFRLPDLRGRVPVHCSVTNDYYVGQMFGSETVTLTTETMPAHNHAVTATTKLGTTGRPSDEVVLATSPGGPLYSDQTKTTDRLAMASGTVTETGDGEAHANMMPFLCVNFVIALTGLYPPRS